MKALVAKEHELASHLVRFTVVLKDACSVVLPNKLCEYLYNLSKKFTSCYGEVRPVETGLLLCRATSVVMEKCFHLLGINPNNSHPYPYRDLILSSKAPKIENPFIPWSNYGDARLEVSRIELFSMYICIYDDIQEGNLHGLISLKDNKTNGFVDFFSRDVCNLIPIGNRSYIFFSDLSASYELSLDSKGLQVRGHIFAWYGKSVLDEVPDADRMNYRACIFTTVGTRVFPGKKLQLDKSFLAVPAGGDLVLQAVLEDTKSREILADDQVTYSLKANKGFPIWEMQVVEKGKAKKGSGSSKSSLAPRFNLLH